MKVNEPRYFGLKELKECDTKSLMILSGDLMSILSKGSYSKLPTCWVRVFPRGIMVKPNELVMELNSRACYPVQNCHMCSEFNCTDNMTDYMKKNDPILK